MSKFNLGDLVRVNSTYPDREFVGRAGTLDYFDGHFWHTSLDDHGADYVFTEEQLSYLVLTPVKPEKWSEFKMLEEIDTMLTSLDEAERERVIRYVMAKNGIDEGGF